MPADPSDADPVMAESGDGWVVTFDDEPAERLDLEDLELVAEVTNPIRGRMMRRLKDPHTVAELAELLDVPVTRLYHHINRLEDHGLIRVVATRRVGAATERRYQVVAKSFAIARHFFDDPDSHELAQAMGALFDVAKLGMEKLIESGGLRGVELDERSILSLGEVSLTPERRAELIRRLRDLVEEFGSEDGGEPMTVFIAAYPEG